MEPSHSKIETKNILTPSTFLYSFSVAPGVPLEMVISIFFFLLSGANSSTHYACVTVLPRLRASPVLYARLRDCGSRVFGMYDTIFDPPDLRPELNRDAAG